MGDLKGHAIPGSFFYVYGLWWAVSCLRRYHACRKHKTRYQSTAIFPLDCCDGRISRLPMEGFVKIFCSSVGFLGELLSHLPAPPAGIVQHATMYFFFLVSGAVDVAMHYRVPLPPSTDYISMVLALTMEGTLFAFHIGGRPLLDRQLHLLLVYVIAAAVVVIALEAMFRSSVILSMARAYLLMLQGTWFWAVGIILYGHSDINAWNLEGHMDVMQATIYFSWHCAVHFICLLVLTVVLPYCHRRSVENDKPNNVPLIKDAIDSAPDRGQTNYGVLYITGLEDDDESDVELGATATQV